MIHKYAPPDVKDMTQRYSIDKGGICGQACLAAIEGRPIQEVLDEWKKQCLEWKGWSGWNQLKQYLKRRGYQVKQKNQLSKYLQGCYYITRIHDIVDEHIVLKIKNSFIENFGDLEYLNTLFEKKETELNGIIGLIHLEQDLLEKELRQSFKKQTRWYTSKHKPLFKDRFNYEEEEYD